MKVIVELRPVHEQRRVHGHRARRSSRSATTASCTSSTRAGPRVRRAPPRGRRQLPQRRALLGGVVRGRTRVRFAPSPTGYFHVGIGAHEPLQLALRAPERRRVHPAHRGHRRRAQRESGVDGIITGHGLARAGLRRGSVLAERPARRARRRRRGALANGVSLRVRLHARTDRRAHQGQRAKPGYDGYCRDRRVARSAATALRFASPTRGPTVVHDMIRGDIDVPARQLRGLHRRASPTASCCTRSPTRSTTAAWRITHIIRGEDLLPTTPKQVMMWEALNACDGVGASRTRSTRTCRCWSTSSARSSPSARTPWRSSSTATRATCPKRSSTTWRCSAGARAATRRWCRARRSIEQFRLEDVSHSPAFFDVKKLDAHER